MPLVSKTFSQIITFTRASTATYFDSAGVLQSAAIDVPRFDYNPATLAARGFLIEEARTNNFTYSAQFDDVIWGKTRTTVTPDAITSPDGTANADKLVEDLNTGSHDATQNFSVSSGTSYTVTMFVKAAERTFCEVKLTRTSGGNLFGGVPTVRVDLSTGTIINTNNVSASSIAPIGNGWYRISASQTATGSGTQSPGVSIFLDATTGSYTGDGTSGIYIWGAQLEVGSFPTSYIPTTTTALTRAADVASVNTLSPWYNAAEGTLFAEGTYIGLIVARQLAALTDNTTSNLISVQTNPSTATVARGSVIVSGSAQASLNGPAGSITAGVTTKMAIAYKTDDFAFSVGGNTPATDSLGTLPVVNRLQIGAAGTAYSTAYLRRITYYPRKLSSAELQAITS